MSADGRAPRRLRLVGEHVDQPGVPRPLVVLGPDGAARLLIVLALSLATVVALLLGGPTRLREAVVGLFVVVGPGLLLVELVRFRDPLLDVVVAGAGSVVGWTGVGILERGLGVWHPRGTLLLVAGLLAAVAALAVTDLLRHGPGNGAPFGRRRAGPGRGRHRGVFPAP